MFAETDRRLDQRFQETDRRLDQRFQETDREIRELAERFKERDKEFRRLEGIFTGQWGKLVEALVAPSALRLFQERGIKVTETCQGMETTRHGSQMRIDVLLSNPREAVVIEVKTTLKVEDVREFMENLEKFTFFFPRYQGMSIYGGVAGIHIEEDADKFAYRQGLFVLRGSGEGLIGMLNPPDFKPKDFGGLGGEGWGTSDCRLSDCRLATPDSRL
jgi:hypothetical protein